MNSMNDQHTTTVPGSTRVMPGAGTTSFRERRAGSTSRRAGRTNQAAAITVAVSEPSKTPVPTSPSGRIADIDDLRAHLQCAIELEHSTLPVYLCALYSLDPARNLAAVEVLTSVLSRRCCTSRSPRTY